MAHKLAHLLLDVGVINVLLELLDIVQNLVDSDGGAVDCLLVVMLGFFEVLCELAHLLQTSK